MVLKTNLFKRRERDRRCSDNPNRATGLKNRSGERRQRSVNWLTLFKDTDEAAIIEAVGDCEVLSLPAGTPLLRPGDANDCVYILLSGPLAAHLDRSVNPEAAFIIHPSECIGEFSAIDGRPVSALVLALENARVLKVSPECFWNRLMPIPNVAKNLLVTLTQRMRRTNEVTLHAQRKQLELQKIEQDLEVARRLQASMLPLRHPIFPGRKDIDVAGHMEPTEKIGGDLFDIFFVDDHLLFFAIGDVSCHGIPAALFMARTIGLIRLAAMSTTRPDQLLERINNQLCEGNDTNMFVTLCCGFLDTENGRLIYSNAGHSAPILINQNQQYFLSIPKGTVAGILHGVYYSTHEMMLTPGDTLLCYTDGITEAQFDGEEYSAQRLLDTVIANAGHEPLQLLQTIREHVIGFTQQNTFSDDCTLLAIHWLGIR